MFAALVVGRRFLLANKFSSKRDGLLIVGLNVAIRII